MASPSAPRVRFAPSPTGYLHIGGVRTALFNWLWARKTGGTSSCASRTPTRSAAPTRAAQSSSTPCSWLGLDWDEGPEVGGAVRPVLPDGAARPLPASSPTSSSPRARPTAATAPRRSSTPSARRSRRSDPKAQFRYPGTCRDRTDQPGQAVRRALQARPTAGAVDLQRPGLRRGRRRRTPRSKTSC